MSMMPTSPFGDLLRKYRLAAGLTQEELAERAGLSAKAITSLERGVNHIPRKETLQLLLAALSLSPLDRERLVAATRPQASLRASSRLQSHGDHPGAPAFVGRARELTLLEQFLVDSTYSAMFLAGEPGIGKTRLLQAGVEKARDRGWTILQGSCQRRGGQELYAPLVEALEGHIALQTVSQRRLLLKECAWLVRLLPELAEIVSVPQPGWGLPPEQERRLMFNAVVRFLANASGPSHGLVQMRSTSCWSSFVRMAPSPYVSLAPIEIRRYTRRTTSPQLWQI
jgi:transcriptional regulator with XRE-family HTH domain